MNIEIQTKEAVMYPIFQVMVAFMGSTLLFLVAASSESDAVTLSEVRFGSDTGMFLFEGEFEERHNPGVEETRDTSNERGVIDWRKIK